MDYGCEGQTMGGCGQMDNTMQMGTDMSQMSTMSGMDNGVYTMDNLTNALSTSSMSTPGLGMMADVL